MVYYWNPISMSIAISFFHLHIYLYVYIQIHCFLVYHLNPNEMYGVQLESDINLWCATGDWNPMKMYGVPPESYMKLCCTPRTWAKLCNFAHVSRPQMLEIASEKQRYHFIALQ